MLTEHNRESWLTVCAKELEIFFRRKRYSLKPYRVTCGWPCKGGLGAKRRTLGECHPPKCNKAGIAELFISPTLAEPDKVAGVLCHELVHVSVGNECQHRGAFIQACRLIGLTGKPTSALPGKELAKQIQKITDALGLYPHEALVPVMKPIVKSASSPLKLVCPSCECIVYISPRWLRDVGVPTCNCGELFEEAI